MLGVAHEIDAWEPDCGVAEMRRDLRNNDVGIRVGANAKRSAPVTFNGLGVDIYSEITNRVMNAGMSTYRTRRAVDGTYQALSPDCTGICF